MRITFIIPEYLNFWEPLGIGYIISWCKEKDIEFNVLFEKFNTKNEIDWATSHSDIVGITCTTPTFNKALKYCERVKFINPNVKTVIGGWHPTVSPAYHTITGDYNFVDHWVEGEGEDAFFHIITGNEKYQVKGLPIYFKEIGWPDRREIHEELTLDYCKKLCGERIASIQSIRGCKFSCKMCAEKCMSNHNIRVRDPEDVLDEIEYLIKDYKIDRIKFVDATWAVSEKVVNEFCEAKIRRGINIKWDAMVHAAIATEEMIKIMSKSNCDIIMIGAESGDQKILNNIGKGVTLNKIKKVFDWGKKYNINRRAFFIIGFPEQDLNSIENTRQFVYKLQPDVVGFTILCPYPGTDYYREEFRNVDWSKADEYSNDFWCTKNFTNKQLKDIQQKLVNEFSDTICWHNREVL